MRLWSVHPKYLDAKGLVALWRETLLAKNVLEGKTKGYKNHPQLVRFKAAPDALNAIHYYLSVIFDEAVRRSYAFDGTKFISINVIDKLSVTTQQMDYERTHLLNKLQVRDPQKYKQLMDEPYLLTHPLFFVVDGPIEPWEKL